MYIFFRFLLLTLPVFNILFFCKDFYLPKTGSLHFFLNDKIDKFSHYSLQVGGFLLMTVDAV